MENKYALPLFAILILIIFVLSYFVFFREVSNFSLEKRCEDFAIGERDKCCVEINLHSNHRQCAGGYWKFIGELNAGTGVECTYVCPTG